MQTGGMLSQNDHGAKTVEHGNYVITGQAADRFRSVAVAALDLRIAKEMIEQCVEDDDSDETSERHEAYWTTALIRFRRAFVKGRHVAWGHEALVAALEPNLKESYARFRMLADKFVAHPVGIGEDMAVTAVLGPSAEGRVTVYGATVRKTRVSSPGTNLAKELSALLNKLIPLANVIEETARTELLDELKTWVSSDLVKGGLYEKTINFDETSTLYKKSLKAYRSSE